MARNTPLHASNKALARQSYQDWLHPQSIGEDPEDIHGMIRNMRPAHRRDLLLAYFYERLSYRDIMDRWPDRYGHPQSAKNAVRAALTRLKGVIEWHRKRRANGTWPHRPSP